MKEFGGMRVPGMAVLLTCSALAGCASTPDPVIGVAASQPDGALGQTIFSTDRPETYALRPSDKISVNVFREPDFTLPEVRIGVEGNVSIPLLGSLPAAGMTAKQFEQDLVRRLAGVGLKSPMVSVNVVEYASHLVTASIRSSRARGCLRRLRSRGAPNPLPSANRWRCSAKRPKGSWWPSSITARSARAR